MRRTVNRRISARSAVVLGGAQLGGRSAAPGPAACRWWCRRSCPGPAAAPATAGPGAPRLIGVAVNSSTWSAALPVTLLGALGGLVQEVVALIQGQDLRLADRVSSTGALGLAQPAVADHVQGQPAADGLVLPRAAPPAGPPGPPGPDVPARSGTAGPARLGSGGRPSGSCPTRWHRRPAHCPRCRSPTAPGRSRHLGGPQLPAPGLRAGQVARRPLALEQVRARPGQRLLPGDEPQQLPASSARNCSSQGCPPPVVLRHLRLSRRTGPAFMRRSGTGRWPRPGPPGHGS